MRDRIVHIKKRIITSLFIILIGGIIFNSTFFLHTHRTACGKIIVHAHPFNKSAEGENSSAQHQHNKFDLQVISSINYYTFSQDYINLDFNIEFELEILSKPNLISDSNIYKLPTTRGPPHESTLV